MKGAIYARYSEGPRQTDQSIEGQVADCRSFAAEKGIDVVAVYADRHVSGKSTEGRDEFQKMMRDAEKHRFDCVIVWKIDRFGRSREDIAVHKIRLRRAGVTLMYARESIPEGPEGILLESLMEGLAEYYSADLRQKVLRGLRENAKKGKMPTGSVPVGYKLEEGRLVLDEPKAEGIRELFRLHIQGMSYDSMRDAMRQYGIDASKNFVWRTLRNERYTGKYEYRGIPIPIPAIISEETFMEAKKHFRTRRNGSEQKALVEYVLRGKARCGICGRLMVGSTGTSHTGQKHHYYRCMTKGCPTRTVKKEWLENLVLQHTVEDVLNDDMIEILVARIMDIQEHEEDPVKRLRRRLAENRRQQGNLAASLAETRLRAVEARLHELEREEDDLLEEIAQKAAQGSTVPEPLVRAWLQSFRAGDKNDPGFRKRLVDAFLADVAVDPEGVTLVYNAKEAPCDGSHSASESGVCETAYKPVVVGQFILLRVPGFNGPARQ